MEKLKLLKEIKTKTLERIIEKFGGVAGYNLKEMKLSIWDAKEILYEEVNKMATKVFEEEFIK